jgi:hypothetical protein
MNLYVSSFFHSKFTGNLKIQKIWRFAKKQRFWGKYISAYRHSQMSGIIKPYIFPLCIKAKGKETG